MEEIKNQVEKQIKEIEQEGVSTQNIDYLYRLIDVHKDLANEEYWKVKEEKYEKELRRIR